MAFQEVSASIHFHGVLLQ